MNSHSLKFLFVYITPVVILFSIQAANYWSYSALVFVFGILPFFELFTNGSSKNLSQEEEDVANENKMYDFLLYGLVPLQYLILFFFLMRVSNPELSVGIKIGLITAYGISCGILGINAAHELGHRTTKYEQFMGKMLLLTSLYMHFFIEHNRGHHKHVSTDDDPASSKEGELVYTFYFRSIIGSWLSAWRLERVRLSRKKHLFWSFHNEMLRFQFVQLLFLSLIFVLWGFQTLICFIASAFIGILLLETVNYIEHYGLRRNKKGNLYERTQPTHSWNSNHPLSRIVLLQLSRHSDHHYLANRKYQILRHFDNSPQMPTGYAGMMLLALVPPLWFNIMNRRLILFNKEDLTQNKNATDN
jgi:alkane 1-monooxygenase